MRKTLTGKISFNFLLIIAITFVASFFIITTSVKDTVVMLEEKNLSNEVEAVTEKINTTLSAKGMLVRQMANDAAIVGFMDSIPNREVLKTLPNYGAVLATLQNTKANSGKDIDLVYFVSEKGDAIFKHNEQGVPPEWSVLKRQWYIDTKAKGDTFYTAPYPDASTGNLVVSVAQPVKKDGVMIGATAIDILIDDIAKMVNAYKVGKNGYIVLLDAGGIVLSHPNKEMVSKPLPDAMKDVQDVMKKKERGTITYQFNGEERIGAFSVVNSSGWRLLAVLPKNDILENIASIQKMIALVYAIAFVVLLFVIIGTMRMMLRQIPAVLSGLDTVKRGDFTATIPVQTVDEIGQIAGSFNNMVTNIKQLLSNAKHVNGEVNQAARALAEVSEQATSMSNEISRAIEQTAVATADQAKSLETASAHVMELDHKFQQILGNSEGLNQAVKAAEETNRGGIEAVSSLKERNNFTNQASREIERTVRQLSVKSDAINTILNTITSISAQTNLLALNASIEAARAGDAGRGFAVVANEIRMLAEASANATNEIKNIVLSIQQEVADSVSKAVQTRETIEAQNQSVEDVNAAFDKISTTISSMSQQIDATSHLIHAVNASKNIIVDNITSVSAVSEETAASTEEVTATLVEQSMTFGRVHESVLTLEKMVKELETELNQFRF